MVCKSCGSPLVPGNPFCPSCGTRQDRVAAVPMKKGELAKKTEYVWKKKSPWVVILAVFLLIVATVGIWFSTTDMVRIVGNWKYERLITEGEKTTDILVKIEFDLFGNATETVEKETVKGKYSINDNMLSVTLDDPKKSEVNPYQFMGSNMIVKDDNFHHPLTRTDLIPFHLIVLAIFAVLELVGMVLLIKQKKIPVSSLIPHTPPVENTDFDTPLSHGSYIPPAEIPDSAIDYGREIAETSEISEKRTIIGLDKFGEKHKTDGFGERVEKSETYIPSTTSDLFSKAGTMDLDAFSMEETKPDTEEKGSRLKSTMRTSDASDAVFPEIPPSDSEHMERAGDL